MRRQPKRGTKKDDYDDVIIPNSRNKNEVTEELKAKIFSDTTPADLIMSEDDEIEQDYQSQLSMAQPIKAEPEIYLATSLGKRKLDFEEDDIPNKK